MTEVALSFLQGGGEMGERMRAFDWAGTALGSPSSWPQSLKTCIRIILTSRQPMFVWWGEQLINLYNDAYRSIVGGKHPEALGLPASVVWAEIWDQVGPRAAQSMRGNEGTYDEALLLIMERHGYQEETYYTFSYSPVPNDEGGTGGIICANTADTARIIGERQTALLRDLATRTADARTILDVCNLTTASLATDPKDFPFSLLYLVEPQGHARLAAHAGIDRGHRAAPETVAEGDDSVWPVHLVALNQQKRLVDELSSLTPLPSGAWPKPPSRVMLLPVSWPGGTGVLVVALNPFRQLDENHKRFLEMLDRQVSAGLANAHAYEREKQRAEALAEIDRAKTMFFSNVSHEFRTPLTLMLGPTEDALARTPQALAGEDLRIVHRNELRLLKLVNALLDFSRIEAGRVQASFEATDLSTLTRDLASSFRAAIERAGLTFRVDCEVGLPLVHVDRDMWEKIVLNLLSNAFKFTFEGSVTVRLAAREAHLELQVEDTGTGVSEEEIPRLFERFHRVQGARSRTQEGSGIGLALVAELVRLHGGSVNVTSAPGKGTRFTILIPIGTAHLPPERVSGPIATNARESQPAEHNRRAFVEEALRWLPDGETTLLSPLDESGPSGVQADPRKRVVVADDNADMRDYVTRLLRTRWTVEAFPDGQSALESILAHPPDLVLTDIMMPHLDGFGLLGALRGAPSTQRIPIIMLSARAGDEARVEGLEAGADDYLVKPFSARELLARVSTHLQIAHLRQEAEAERRRMDDLRAAAESASRAKDEFLSTLSHELRTPLNAIVGWANLLLSSTVPPDRIRQAVETIERNARAQARLIEDMLDLARIEQGKLTLNVGPVEMVKVIEAAMDVVRPACNAKGVRLQPVLDANATIVGDPDRLQQIVWNLLSNAMKFTPKGGRIQVSLRRTHSHVEVSVSDNGQGIEPEFLPHVFDRFRQADQSISRKMGGLGLGLAIVRSLVELHGGTAVAHSEGPSKGATFTIQLPTAPIRSDSAGRQTDRAPAVPPTFESPPGLKGLRLLIVDDERETRELLRFVLEECGAIVTMAASAAEAFVTLRSRPFDMLVSDVGMPEEDGYSLLRRVRTLPAHEGGTIPALALTAYARAEDRTQALRAGFDMHMSKPILPAELTVIIDRLVDRHRQRGVSS